MALLLAGCHDRQPGSKSASSTTVSSAATSTATTALSLAGRLLGGFAGRWTLHVTLLAVDPTGYAILSWRTYRTCGDGVAPCDITAGNEIIDGGHATLILEPARTTSTSGTVLTTTAATSVPLGPFTAILDPVRDLLTLSLPLFAGQPLCGPKAAALSVAEQKGAGINCGA